MSRQPARKPDPFIDAIEAEWPLDYAEIRVRDRHGRELLIERIDRDDMSPTDPKALGAPAAMRLRRAIAVALGLEPAASLEEQR